MIAIILDAEEEGNKKNTRHQWIQDIFRQPSNWQRMNKFSENV